LADEPCNYDGEKEGDVSAAYKDGSTEKSDHTDRLIRSGIDATL
jgi:hypothetical protein